MCILGFSLIWLINKLFLFVYIMLILRKVVNESIITENHVNLNRVPLGEVCKTKFPHASAQYTLLYRPFHPENETHL